MKLLHASLLSVLFLTHNPEPATACMNEVLISSDEARQRLQKAEKALAEGKNTRAVSLLDDITVKDPELSRRMQRLFAVARMRNNEISLGLSTLEEQLKASPDDPYLQTRVAEGLSMLRKNKEANRKRALAMLEALERADLIPDAEGDLVLARLRAAANDQAGSEKALARCQKRSSDPTKCTLPK